MGARPDDHLGVGLAALTALILGGKKRKKRRLKKTGGKNLPRGKTVAAVSPAKADLFALQRSGVRWWRKRKLRARCVRLLRGMGVEFGLGKRYAPVREGGVNVVWYGVAVPAWWPEPQEAVELPTKGGE